jgi:hypothetical protein
VEDIKKLVDQVKAYTNFFVIGSTGITFNTTKLDEVCQYIYENDLYFTIFFHLNEDVPQAQWVEDAKSKWGNHFAGLYAYDEPGGHQIDQVRPYMLVEEADNYTDAATKYVEELNRHLLNITDKPVYAGDLPLFTSDYALYWFDYKGGYDVVFAEFGWNHSRLLNVALCRGAATVQGKEWGVMITWTYNEPPYLESGPELYDDMVLAYESGANYIIIFDTDKNYTHSILQQEHLDAMKKFHEYTQTNPRKNTPTTKRTAYVLPKNYGYGFRGSEKVWGLWVDELSIKIATDLLSLLNAYHSNLDIIYDDPQHYNIIHSYDKLYFWNETLS